MLKLPDGKVVSSASHKSRKESLDGGIGLVKSCQHLGPKFKQLSATKKIESMLNNAKQNNIKTPDKNPLI
jgi:hypothetical protein